jgi:lysophospholipase L1-like esterase
MRAIHAQHPAPGAARPRGPRRRACGGALLVALACALGAVACSAPNDPNCTGLPVVPDVAILGDSIFALAKADCTQVGRWLGDKTGEHYPDFSVSGATFQSAPGAPRQTIPRQYFDAQARNAPTVLILDGGGNDLLRFCPDSDLPDCTPAIAEVEQEVRALVAQALADGVQHIVYLGIYHVDPNGVAGRVAATVDPAMDRMAQVADELGIVFVDPRPYFDGHPLFISDDGLHPTPVGSALLAELIYDAMVTNGILQ